MNSRKKPINNYQLRPIHSLRGQGSRGQRSKIFNSKLKIQNSKFGFKAFSSFLNSKLKIQNSKFGFKAFSSFLNSKLKIQNSKLHSKGFTLIELIIFIIIAGIFLPATYVAFSAAMKQGTKPEDYTRGMLLTEQVMELGIKRGYAQLVLDAAAAPTCATVIGVSVPAGYSCTFTPSALPTNFFSGLTITANNYIQITVSVTTPQANTFSSTGMVTNHGF